MPLYGGRALRTGEPFVAHADGMFEIVRELRADPDLLAAAYLFGIHDVLRDADDWLRGFCTGGTECIAVTIAAGCRIGDDVMQPQSSTNANRLAVATGIRVASVTLHAIVERRIIEATGSMTIGTGVSQIGMCTVTGPHVGKRSVARRTAWQTTPATIVKSLERDDGRCKKKDEEPENNAGKKHSGVGIHGRGSIVWPW